MRSSLELSPLGTARAGVLPAGMAALAGTLPGCGLDPELGLLQWLLHVRRRLRELYNLEDEVAFLAWELARWQPGISLLQRQAMILLIITVQVHLRLGSTRIAWSGEQGDAIRLSLATNLLSGLEPIAGFAALADPGQAANLMVTIVSSGQAAV